MGELMYNIAAKKLKNTGFFAPAFVVFTAILFVGISMGLEDYLTSVRGYMSTPSAKIIGVVVWLVAALPQLIQMAMTYIIIGFAFGDTDSDERDFYGLDIVSIAFCVWLSAFLLDGYWDYIYKITGYTGKEIEPDILDLYWFTVKIYWSTLFESYFVYGLLSEVLSTVIGGVWVAMFRQGAFDDTLDLLTEMGEAFGELFGLITHTIKSIFAAFFGGLKSDKSKNRKKQPNQKTQSKNNQSRNSNKRPDYQYQPNQHSSKSQRQR